MLAIFFMVALGSFLFADTSLTTPSAGLSGPKAANADSPLSLAVWPTMTVPLGDGAAVFLLSAGGGASGELPLGFLPGLKARLNLGVSTLRIKSLVQDSLKDSITELGGQLGASYELPLTPWLNLRFLAGGGLAYGGMASDFGGGNAYGLLEGGVGLGFIFDPSLSLRLDASYLHRMGLYGGVNASLSLAWALPGPSMAKASAPAARPKLLDFTELRLSNVYPIFQSFYDEHPLGTLRVTNTGKESARNVKVNFIMRQYMDGPKECATIPELKPGESVEVPLLALFRNNILDVTEATKATAEITLDYQDSVDTLSQSKTASVQVQNRNAMTWDDDRKAAAFVSGKDPWVLDLSNGVIAAVREQRNPALNQNLQTAIAVHAALRQYGISYVTNPKTPFAEVKGNPTIIDFLKFPRQTLDYRAGNCSDLTILYASLFESVGIETAFITIPGHLYLAISLETSPDKARAEIANAGDLIYRDGKAWMPLELTMRDNTLAEIWAEGAREWRQGVSTANAGFFPVHEAWKTFAPVGLPADGRSLEALAAEKVVRAFRSEAELLVRQEMDARIATVNGDIKKNGETPKLLNQRGVAYARFGQLDLAAKDFAAAGKKGDFLPALVNLGNVAMLKNDGKLAWDSFQKAAKLSPDNVAILASRDKAAALAGKAAQPVMASAGGKAGTAAPGTGAAAAVPLGESGMRAAQVTTGPEWMEE